MPSTIRQQKVIENLKLQLQKISIKAGYYSNLGLNVSDWRTTPFEPSELPGLDIRDSDDVIDDEGALGEINAWTHMLKTTIEVVCVGTESAATIRQMIYDVFKAIKVDTTLGQSVVNIFVRSYKIEAKSDEKKVVGGTIELDIQFQTNKLSES